MFNDAIIADKRNSLLSLLRPAVAEVSGRERLIAFVVDQFADLEPPEVDTRLYNMTMQPGGFGGGASRKPGNITLNWRRLFVAVSEAGLAASGVALQPWLFPLAGLVMWNALWSLLDIKIDERHAAVLWALWTLRGPDNRVDKAHLPERVNEALSQFNHPAVTPTQLQRILAELERLECLESANRDNVWLREWVRAPWE